MARPRIFISSTYFDFKSVRADLEQFIRESGYDPVLHERGNVAYTKENSPEVDCYREIESCDILVAIIGGRFGTASNAGPYSISQAELKTAVENNKQVYIFVERDVAAEYRTYLANKEIKVSWAAVDDVSIYTFLEEVYSLPANNAVLPFDTSRDIVTLLREQWAGLFQKLLQQAAAEGPLAMARELRQGIDTARQLVELLGSVEYDTKQIGRDAVEAVLLPNHPAYARIRKLLRVPYRVYFTNISELNEFLKVRNFEGVVESAWDHPSFREWYNERDQKNWDLFKISTQLFDADGLFVPNTVQWNDGLVKRQTRPREDIDPDDDDVPF